MTRVTAWVFTEPQLEEALAAFLNERGPGITALAPASVKEFLHSDAMKKARTTMPYGAPEQTPAKIAP